ncbi:MAG: lipocalin family protein [Bacteroidales bacterium]|nr:lipocalin family protein [Bacteroidales bacterium]
MKRVFIQLIILVVIFLGACNKETLVSFDQLLTNGTSRTWLLSAVVLPDSVVDSNMDTCKFDDTYGFDIDGNYWIDFGEKYCDDYEEEVETDSGTWKLNAYQDQILFQNEEDTNFVIFRFSGSQLVLMFPEEDYYVQYFYSACDTCK